MILFGLRGLKENLSKGLDLLVHLLNNAKADQKAYDKYVQRIEKAQQARKIQKRSILQGLVSYGQYGANSPMRDILQIEELKAINPQELVDLVKGIKNYKQRIFYYGKDVKNAVASLNTSYKVGKNLKEYPPKKEYKQLKTGRKVFFANYDMVQAEVVFMAKKGIFNPKDMAVSALFNSYFGGGMSSVVFQEIRESKSLAYSVSASYSQGSEKGKSDYVFAYVGTQANKLKQAIKAMMDLMSKDMPEAERQFEVAKTSMLKAMATQRTTKSSIFWSYESLKKLGLDDDYRKKMYEAVQKMTLKDIKAFFNKNIKGSAYNIMVIGNKKDLDIKSLKKLGKFKELKIDYIFNYVNTKKSKKAKK